MDTSDDELGWFWMCYGCGQDVPYKPTGRLNRRGYDAYWSKDEDTQVSRELDDFFYDAYPQFKS